MIGIILTVLVFLGALKLTGWAIKICGKLLGVTFGLAGAVIIGILGITVAGLAVFMLPVIIVAGIIGIAGSCIKIFA